VTPIVPTPEAVVVTNQAGFIESMNGAATTLLGLPPRIHAHPRQIGLLFVKGRVAVRAALREVFVGGPAVLRPASIQPNGGGMVPLTVSITGLDDGFRWVLRPAAVIRRAAPHQAPARRR
jgi:PAS domain-containing protein